MQQRHGQSLKCLIPLIDFFCLFTPTGLVILLEPDIDSELEDGALKKSLQLGKVTYLYAHLKLAFPQLVW